MEERSRKSVTVMKRYPEGLGRANRKRRSTKDDLLAQIEIMQWKLAECRQLREKLQSALVAHGDRVPNE